jgi:HSP20 family molecular chaperone IbpA
MNPKGNSHNGDEQVGRANPPRERSRETVAPAIDVCETDTGWLLVADMPGVAKDGADVQVERGVLTISGKIGTEPHFGRTVYNGFQRLDYFRSVALSDEVDRTKISASQSDGVLTIVLPKAAAAQTRKIMVQAG